MKNYIKAEIQITGMDELEKLAKRQMELLRELSDNMTEIEAVRLEVNLKMNGADA